MDIDGVVQVASYCDSVSLQKCNDMMCEANASSVIAPLKLVFYSRRMIKENRDDVKDAKKYIEDIHSETQSQFKEAQKVDVGDILTDGGKRELVLREVCVKCGCKEQWMYTKQQRSVDEGANAKLECMKCKYRWTHRG